MLSNIGSTLRYTSSPERVSHARSIQSTALLRESAVRLRPALATLDPTLALYCVRLPWAAVSVYQMCEWAAGHTVRHISQVNRELQIAVMNGVAV
jgi:hypothetical protein